MHLSSAQVTEGPRTVSVVEIQDVSTARTFESTKRHTDVSAEDLSEQWHIGIGQAAETLKCMYQKFVRSVIMPLARRNHVNRIFHK